MNYPDLFLNVREAYASRTEPEAARFLALSLWRMIIVLAIVSIGGSILWGMWSLFSTLAALEPSATVPRIVKPPIDRSALVQTVSGLSQRGERFQKLKDTPVTISDPSN